MALFYNNDGTVSEIIINAIIDGKVTSSLGTTPTINDSVFTSASNAIVNKAISAGSSSADAYGLGFVKGAAFTPVYTYLSSVTVTPAAFNSVNEKTAYTNLYGTRVEANFSHNYYTYLSSATLVNSVFGQTLTSQPQTNWNNFAFNYTTPLMIEANTTLNAIIDADGPYIDIDITNINDGSVSPNLSNINAQKFATTYTNGNVLVVGDDSIVKDVNIANGFGVIGQQAATKGWVRFGSGGPLVGYNNTDAFPAADSIYSVTGSMLIKTNHLYFFNGDTSNNGWSQII